jgi:hypothetical protein
VQEIIKRSKAARTKAASADPTREEHATMSLSGSLATTVADFNTTKGDSLDTGITFGDGAENLTIAHGAHG